MADHGRTPDQNPAGIGLLTVLLGAVAAGPIMLYGLSATSDSIIAELGISEARFGLLATTCFGAAAIGNATLGRLADRHSDLSLMAFIFVLSALALLLVAVPDGFGMLLLAAALSGIAQSFPNGVTNRILLERVPDSKRISWVGIKQSGVQVSQLVASLAFPVLALGIGWRGAALTVAIIPLILLAMTWSSLRTTPLLTAPKSPVDTAAKAADPNPDTSADTAAEASHPDPELASTRPARHPGMVWALALFGLINGIGVQATNVYIPLFAVREMGFSLVLGGAAAALAGVISVIARVTWARRMAKGASGPRLLLVLALIALAGAVLFLVADAAGWSLLVWVAVAFHGISALGVSVVLMAALMRAIPASSMVSASGMVTAGMFFGFALGPLLMGIIVGSPGGFVLGWITVGITYVLCMILALILIHAVHRRH
ncbi:Sugar phosphate permease [Brevibacterium siliguriense]|uniref:Sugar phosphate permease n=1 Tax=Brevibacterium siliguriense TaxID=1136497 RepID=A0A1H1QFQ9_9MICO|nr:MFS transporter [Brevibacterium siliguriense]SDS21719.1 Sugar phosphate permease [Brevibacterium siliguriense]